MDNSTVPPQIEERHQPSFLKKYRYTIITLCIILIALVPLMLLTKSHKPSAPVAVQAGPTPTPTTVPLTEQNAEPTLDAVNQHMQQAITQSNQDLNSISQIDSSQDSVAGL